VQYNKQHGAAGLRLTHKGSKGFLSKADKQAVLGWISEQSGKTQIRKQPTLKTFTQVNQYFVDAITDNTYNYEKFNWYFT
jgi:hypothetical protein